MKLRPLLALSVATLLLMSISFAGEGDQKEKPAADGKSIFMSAKCGSCHYISKFELGKKPVEGKANAAPDLSTVGSKHTSEFMAKFVKKSESIKGKKHMVAFKGSDPELKTLVDWLALLKAEAAK